MTQEKKPVLYVAVNTELYDMTNGKAAAHSGHASNAAVYHMRKNFPHFVEEWEEDRGFGTQINLAIPKADWLNFGRHHSESLSNPAMSGIVTDLTYPAWANEEVIKLFDEEKLSINLSDTPIINNKGQRLITFSAQTALWIFCYTESPMYYNLKKYSLQP